MEKDEEVGTVANDVAEFFSEETPERFEDMIEEFPPEESFELPKIEEEEEVDEPTGDKDTDDPPEVDDPPAPEPKVDDPPAVPEIDSEGKPVVPAVKDDEPPSAEVDPTVKALQDQVATLLQKVETLQTPAEPKVETPAADTLTQADVYDFVGEADLDTILSSKDEFNKFLSSVVNSTINTTTENIYKNLPSAVSSQVTQQNGLKAVVDEFYKENADLLPVRKTVAGVSNEVAAEHPEFTIEQIFKETETRTRAMLGLKKGEVPTEKPETSVQSKPKKPALPGKQGGRAGDGKKKLSLQDRHIGDVL